MGKQEARSGSRGELQETKRPVESFVTERGSVYTYLADGRVERKKTVTGEVHEPADLVVFVPSYEWLNANHKDIAARMGGDEKSYTDTVLSYVHGATRGKNVYAVVKVDGKIKIIKNNKELKEVGRGVVLAFTNNNSIELAVPVNSDPEIGWFPFDRKYYDDPSGGKFGSHHFGHKVTSIKYANK